MKIVFVSSEVAPFSKTGGLADVIGALPKALAALGHEVCVITPFYRCVKDAAERENVKIKPNPAGPVSIPIGNETVTLSIQEGRLPDSNVPLYFLDHPAYFDRPGLYVEPEEHTDYPDNCKRFIALPRGALELCEALDIRPDVLHCHDWQTGLAPVYVKTLYRSRHNWATVGTVFTIHNIQFQGLFWHWDMKPTGLPWELFNWRMLEYYANLSFLKGGLVFADVLTTVSGRYAEEIQTPEFGEGMENVLQQRSHDLYGIINGIDHGVWSPETDEMIAATYSVNEPAGKAACKKALQRRFDLPAKSKTPMIGMVARLAPQKGLDLIEDAMPHLMKRDLQLVILGTGSPHFHKVLAEWHEKNPKRFGLVLGFDNALAHQIEAGSDMFLMPSKFEPCGLNQLYSLRYGTVPVVRLTGGLADTINEYNRETVRAGIATGFGFEEYTAEAMLKAIDKARRIYKQPEKWHKLMRICMGQDWSWQRSAEEYVQVYAEAAEKASQQQ